MPRAWVRPLLFAAVAAVVAVALAGRTTAAVGPFECTAVARPALVGETRIRLAPLGSIHLDTHTGPVAIELRVDELRRAEAERIAADPQVLEALEDDLAADARTVLEKLAARSLIAAMIGGLIGAVAARLSVRTAVVGSAVGLIIAGTIGTAAVVSFRPEAVAEPRYSGLLSVAPRAVGDVEAVVERFDDYRAQLTELVGNVVTIYRAAERLPSLDPGDGARRLLHVSDVHNNPQAFDLIDELVDQFGVDLVVDTGDITDWGTEPESRLLERVEDVDVPYVYVRGNHDSTQTQEAIADQGAIVLDAEAVDVAGIRIWGIGDPRFTPNKDQPTGKDVEAEQIEAFAPEVRRELQADDTDTVDVLAVHDARAAAGVGDLVPLVLSGHAHAARQSTIDDAVLLVEGSTGGAGLRGLQGRDAEPLTCSVLYFDPETDRLVAYDRISVDGFGGAGARIERHVLEAEEAE